MTTAEVASPVGSGARSPKRKRRVALWICGAVAVVAAVLIAVLATSGPEGQLSTHSPLLGKPAPGIKGPNLMTGSGQPATVSVGGPSGHWILVNFAASWCVPCQQEMPQLLTFAARHEASGNAQIVTVAYDEGDKANLVSYFRSRKVTWPVVDDNTAKVAYGVTGIPESYLVDPEGRVVAKIVSGVNADNLDRLIAPYSGS